METEQFDALMVELNRHSRELKQLRELTSQFVNQMDGAEREIPEFMRRFVNYFHDLHDVKYMYEELGVVVPDYLFREVERVHDRLRQLLEKLHTDGGIFEKVRREMASDPLNQFDHTRLLFPPKLKEKLNEARTGEQQQNGRDESGADSTSGLARGG